jgi:thousand and one amino acid protein kinase
MLMRHHEQTRELEMRQQKSVHVLREEHLRRQHDTELTNQVLATTMTSLNCT